MPALLQGFSEVFDILKGIFSGLKTIADNDKNHRKEIRDALADTAKLIDETLTILKQHLNAVILELKSTDKTRARQLISELGNFQEWEKKFRKFQLCDSLRNAVLDLENKGLYNYLNPVSLKDPQSAKQRMWDYIGGEQKAAQTVGEMLQHLSQLANFSEAEYDQTVARLTEARDEIGKMRQHFIDLELEIRNSI